MVSDAGQIIRCPIDQISIIGRSGRGVSIFNVEDSERLVSVSRFRDLEDDNVEESRGTSTQSDIENESAEGGNLAVDHGPNVTSSDGREDKR